MNPKGKQKLLKLLEEMKAKSRTKPSDNDEVDVLIAKIDEDLSSEIEELIILLQGEDLNSFKEEAFKRSSSKNADNDPTIHVLYWQIAKIAFKPKTMKEMVDLLFPNMGGEEVNERINDMLHEAINNQPALKAILRLIPESERLAAIEKKNDFGESVLYLAVNNPQILRGILFLLPETKNLTALELETIVNLSNQIKELKKYGDQAEIFANKLLTLTTDFIVAKGDAKEQAQSAIKNALNDYSRGLDNKARLQQPILKKIEIAASEAFTTAKPFRTTQVERYTNECDIQIARLQKYDNPIANQKAVLLKEAKEKLQDKKVTDPGERLSNFYTHIRKNQKELVKPHSSLPKDIIKGLITFIGYILGIYPGVKLQQRLFGESRPTTTGEKIVQPVLDDTTRYYKKS